MDNFCLQNNYTPLLLSLTAIFFCPWAMRKFKLGTISRETPATPSPEKLPSMKLRLLSSPPQTRILRRKVTPTCCNFGKHRKALYPEYFFGHNCTDWETHAALGVKVKGSRPASLPCTANHTSFIFPSTKMSIYSCPNRSKMAKRSAHLSVVSPLHSNVDGDTEEIAS